MNFKSPISYFRGCNFWILGTLKQHFVQITFLRMFFNNRNVYFLTVSHAGQVGRTNRLRNAVNSPLIHKNIYLWDLVHVFRTFSTVIFCPFFERGRGDVWLTLIRPSIPRSQNKVLQKNFLESWDKFTVFFAYKA